MSAEGKIFAIKFVTPVHPRVLRTTHDLYSFSTSLNVEKPVSFLMSMVIWRVVWGHTQERLSLFFFFL